MGSNWHDGKEVNSDQSKTENSLTTTGIESSERRNLLSVMNYGKVTEYIYTDGNKEVIRNG